MGTLQEERWQKDRDSMIAQAKALGVSVDVQGANNDKDKQISQAESMIAKGVNVLLIAPYDATSMAGVISDAHKAGIKVISYDRLMTKSNADYYVSFDNEKVGQFEAQSIVDAMKDKLGKGKVLKFAYIGGSPTDNNATLLKKGSFEVLQPLIDKGQIEIVVDKPTADWTPDIAYQNLKAYLDSSNGAVDAVVCANDGTAFGAIKALQEHNLAGKVPVSGQDAELAALQRIVAGTQTATVYKPIPREDAAALDMAIKLANNQKIDANAKVNDGQIDVPSVLLEPTLVTKDNLASTVIKDNYHTSAEIYQK
jgi:D-xylose transport system substrate-binding protein